MKNTRKLILILMFLVIAIVAAPLLLNYSDFSGTDGAAEKAIAVMDPNYEQWVKPMIKLPGGETETLLFCLQTGIGAGVLGFGFGYLFARKKYQKGNDSK